MRDYSKVSPRFWTGETGKQIKARGIEAQMLALYLQTSPHANMLGLYYLPIPFICHETGLSPEGASKALRSLSEVGFCAYDDASEHVFVFKMAEWQIGPSLSENDNRVKGIRKDFAALPKNPFSKDFYARYSEKFHLEEQAEKASPFEAPSKPGTGAGAGTEEKHMAPRGADTSRKSKYTPEFEKAWSIYPKRTGGNPKHSAFKAWTARLKSGATAEDLTAGVIRYARFVKSSGKEGTEFVKQAATFFGPDEHFRESWETEAPEQSYAAGAI